MSTIVKMVAAIFCLASLPVMAIAQEPNHCEWLLKYGIYDTKTYEYDRHNIGHLKTLIQASEAKTYQEFESSGTSIGLDVPAIAAFKFGGYNAKSEFLDWKKALLTATDYGAQDHEKLRVVVREISPTLMKAVQNCIDTRSQTTVVAWFLPQSDEKSFVLRLKFNPTSGEQKAEIRAITILGPKETILLPVGEEQRNLIKKGAIIPIEGLSVSFQRRDVRDAVTVTYNTSSGSGELRIAGLNPNEAVDQLSRKLEVLEAKLTAAEATMTKLTAEQGKCMSAITELTRLVSALQTDVKDNVLRKDTAYDLSPADAKETAFDFWDNGIKKGNVLKLHNERNGTNGQRLVIRVPPPENK